MEEEGRREGSAMARARMDCYTKKPGSRPAPLTAYQNPIEIRHALLPHLSSNKSYSISIHTGLGGTRPIHTSLTTKLDFSSIRRIVVYLLLWNQCRYITVVLS